MQYINHNTINDQCRNFEQVRLWQTLIEKSLQMCRMDFVSTVSKTDLDPYALQYNHNISLNCYTLSKIRMCKSVITGMKAIIVEVTLGRPIVNFLLTLFVPTILLVTISFFARFFAEDYIDMVIQVNLTILLVLGTM